MKNTPLTFFLAGCSRWWSMRFRYVVSMVATFLFFGSPAQAAVALQLADGKLIGASGVIVNGTTYDVQFKDGSCVSLFSGCDQMSDFVFQSEASARLAAQALIDQVFLNSGAGSFDSAPSLTNGCTHLNVCSLWMPYGFPYGRVTGSDFSALYTSNRDVWGYYGEDQVNRVFSWDKSWDTSSQISSAFAVWSPSIVSAVPEPDTQAMMLVGLALVGVSACRRKAEQTA